MDPARRLTWTGRHRTARAGTRRATAHVDRSERHRRRSSPRAGRRRRPITPHAALLARALGAHGDPAAVVARHAPRPPRRAGASTGPLNDTPRPRQTRAQPLPWADAGATAERPALSPRTTTGSVNVLP